MLKFEKDVTETIGNVLDINLRRPASHHAQAC